MPENRLPELVGNILKNYLKKHRYIDLKLLQYNAILAWEKINSSFMNSHSEALGMKGKILMVKTDSTVIANELALKEKELVERLNREIGENVIDRVIFKSGYLRKKNKKNKSTDPRNKPLDISTIKKIENITVELKDDELRDIMKRFLISVAKKR